MMWCVPDIAALCWLYQHREGLAPVDTENPPPAPPVPTTGPRYKGGTRGN